MFSLLDNLSARPFCHHVSSPPRATAVGSGASMTFGVPPFSAISSRALVTIASLDISVRATGGSQAGTSPWSDRRGRTRTRYRHQDCHAGRSPRAVLVDLSRPSLGRWSRTSEVRDGPCRTNERFAFSKQEIASLCNWKAQQVAELDEWAEHARGATLPAVGLSRTRSPRTGRSCRWRPGQSTRWRAWERRSIRWTMHLSAGTPRRLPTGRRRSRRSSESR